MGVYLNQEYGTKIVVLDAVYGAETTAMLQAFYSRSHKSITERLSELDPEWQTRKARNEDKIQKALGAYYIGYGHASIADCGSITIFIEGVSHFVAKAIQDNQLYNGQESSTRYIDYSNQPFTNPYLQYTHKDNTRSKAASIIKNWTTLYNNYLPSVIEGLKILHPINDDVGEDPVVWEKSIKARAFDIMRGYLSTASHTQLSWHTTLRQARDNLRKMLANPITEVRDIAFSIYEALSKEFPNSFNDNDLLPNSLSRWYEDKKEDFYNVVENGWPFFFTPHAETSMTCSSFYNEYRRLSYTTNGTPREKGTPIPYKTSGYLHVDISTMLDYASWRDIQRHRNGICVYPSLISTLRGTTQANALEIIHPWYLDQVKMCLDAVPHNNQLKYNYSEFEFELSAQLDAVLDFIEKRDYDDLEIQYLAPLGILVRCDFKYTIPELVYIAELRSGQHIHPTLRKLSIEFAEFLSKLGIHHYADTSGDKWSLKRGSQDIVKKQE